MSGRLVKTIFEYEAEGDYPQIVKVFRTIDGSVFITVRGPEINLQGTTKSVGGDFVTMKVPAAQWRKLVAAFAIEPDLFPGTQDEVIKNDNSTSCSWSRETEVGKPYGGPLG